MDRNHRNCTNTRKGNCGNGPRLRLRIVSERLEGSDYLSCSVLYYDDLDKSPFSGNPSQWLLTPSHSQLSYSNTAYGTKPVNV